MRATDDEGNTGMPFAARNGHVAAMALLRDAGVHFLCFVFLLYVLLFVCFYFCFCFMGNFQFSHFMQLLPFGKSL